MQVEPGIQRLRIFNNLRFRQKRKPLIPLGFGEGVPPSLQLQTSRKWRVVRRSSDQDLVGTRRKSPAVLRFVEGLQDSGINRNRDGLRLARRQRHSLPTSQSLVGFVVAFRRPRVDLRDFRPCAFPGVFDGKPH